MIYSWIKDVEKTIYWLIKYVAKMIYSWIKDVTKMIFISKLTRLFTKTSFACSNCKRGRDGC